MTDNRRPPSIMFIAGEPSGDMHASRVIRELKSRDQSADIWGVGGPAMAAAGLEQVMPFEPFNRMGYVEVVRHLPFFLDAKRKLIRVMKTVRRPDVLVCVDYSGFNMPMMKAARKLGVPVVWYIAPMVWAWKRKRAKTLGGQASHIAVIFPFETRYFEPYPAPVTFVGNPLVEQMECGMRNAECGIKTAPSSELKLALIPGSRPQEIANMLGVMIDAAVMLREKHPGVKVAVSRFHRFDEKLFARAKDCGFEIFSGPLTELLRESGLALVTSGTATLEAALMGVPAVITYRTSPVSYAIYRSFVKISHIGLPNIVAGKSIVPECVQGDANPQKLFEELDKFVSDPAYRESAVKNLSSLRARLGEKKPSAGVADIVYSYLR